MTERQYSKIKRLDNRRTDFYMKFIDNDNDKLDVTLHWRD